MIVQQQCFGVVEDILLLLHYCCATAVCICSVGKKCVTNNASIFVLEVLYRVCYIRTLLLLLLLLCMSIRVVL